MTMHHLLRCVAALIVVPGALVLTSESLSSAEPSSCKCGVTREYDGQGSMCETGWCGDATWHYCEPSSRGTALVETTCWD